MGAVGDFISSVVDPIASVVSDVISPVVDVVESIPVVGDVVSGALDVVSTVSDALDVIPVVGPLLVDAAEVALDLPEIPIPEIPTDFFPSLDPGTDFFPSLDPGETPMNGDFFDPTASDGIDTADITPGDAFDPSFGDPTMTDPGFAFTPDNITADVLGADAGGPSFSVPSLRLPGFGGGGSTMTVANRSLARRSRLAPSPELIQKGLQTIPGALTASGRWLLNQMRKFGPAAAAGLTAGEILNLLLAGNKKRRRMNPCNTKALGRATRRLISFENRASKVSAALACLVGSRTRVRVRKKCSKCKRSPCTCR